MIFHEKSRRQFLTGTGKLGAAGLLLPALPSLMPRSTWGAPLRSPMRLIMCLTPWGQFNKTWHPQGANLQTLDAVNNVKGVKLTDLPGNVSDVIGPEFSPLKAKMTLIKGLSVPSYCQTHNFSAPSCASGLEGGCSCDCGVPAVKYSAEYVLGLSKKVYPDDTNVEKYVGFHVFADIPYSTTADRFNQYAHTPTGKLPIFTDLKALYSRFARSFNGTSVDPKNDPVAAENIKLVQDSIQDYRSVRDSGKLSSADKPRFEAYMNLVAEVEKNLSAPRKVCPDPNPALNAASMPDDAAKLMTAAVACGLTNVVDWIVSIGGLHASGHNGQVPEHTTQVSKYGKWYAKFWNMLDGFKDPDGNTVLDNSITLWASNAGLNDRGPHQTRDIPLLVAGSAGGKLKTGYFIDYGARTMNRWLVTVFNAFGLTQQDYELRPGQVGFGEYTTVPQADRTWRGILAPDEYTDSVKRTPLPFIWRG